MTRVENCISLSLMRGVMDGADLRHTRTDTNTCTLSLCRQILSPETLTQWPSPWRARSLIVAAGKRRGGSYMITSMMLLS